jgi:hypothetical protein
MHHRYKEKNNYLASFNTEIRRVVLENKKDKHTWYPPHAFNEGVTAHSA